MTTMRKDLIRVSVGLAIGVLVVLLVSLVVYDRIWLQAEGASCSANSEFEGGEDDGSSVGFGLSGRPDVGEVFKIEESAASSISADTAEPTDVGARRLCPVQLSNSILTDFRHNVLGEGWTYETREGISAVGEEVLAELRGGGYRLICATQMDLFGRAWGCIVTSGEAVLVVHAAPSMVSVSREGGGSTLVSICNIVPDGGV